jgi:spermidine synthase
MDYNLKLAIEAQGYIRESACTSEIVSLYPVQKVLWTATTPYSEAIIAECPGLGKTLFLDNEIQSSETDEMIYHECLVHPVMAAANSRKKVLVIGGGEGATVREVMKWPDVEKIMWIDIDKDLVNACKTHLGWAPPSVYTDERVIYKGMDIRTFLELNEEPYNVIIIDLPDPDIHADMNDPAFLQNAKFWKGIRKSLADNGVFATHCGPVHPMKYDNGIAWVREAAANADIPMYDSDLYNTSAAYHTVIPSFQGDWGFLMSVKPCKDWHPSFPTKFMSLTSHKHIFMWP